MSALEDLLKGRKVPDMSGAERAALPKPMTVEEFVAQKSTEGWNGRNPLQPQDKRTPLPESWSYPRSAPIVHSVVQGTDKWRMLRAGIPTASQFHRIITPKKMELSASRKSYMFHLIGERILGRYVETYASPSMKRGSDLESDALSFYQMATDSDTTPCGFMTEPGGRWGASPDLLVGADGCGEIKCPDSISTHVAWLLNDASIADDYRAQVQGQLWIADREWVDTIAYHPDLPKAIRRTHRDEAFITALARCVQAFSAKLEAATAKCRELGFFEAVHRPEPRGDQEPLGPMMKSVEDLIAEAKAAGAVAPDWTL